MISFANLIGFGETKSFDSLLLLWGEGGRVGRMRGHFKFLKFLTFLFIKSPHPPLAWSPLSQNGRGFLDCVELKAVCHWARIFEPLISFANFIFLLRSPSWSFVFSLREKVAAGQMREFLQISNFPHLFLICNNPSPTADAVPPLPKRARVCQSSADSTICQWARVFRLG